MYMYVLHYLSIDTYIPCTILHTLSEIIGYGIGLHCIIRDI